MKIAFYSEFLYPELSGIVDSITITGRELTRRGHSVVFVGPHYNKKEYDLVKREPLPILKGYESRCEDMQCMPVVRLPSISMPGSPTKQSRIAFPIGKSFSFMETFQPDIIHVQGPFGAGFEAVRVSKKFHIPLVGTNHTPIEEFSPPGMGQIMRHYDAWFYNHCDYVTTPASTLIKSMREAGFTKPGDVLPNPAEIQLFSQPSLQKKMEAKHELGIAGPVILYVGRLAKEKRIDLLIEAIAKLKPEFPLLKLVATGQGTEERRLRTLAKKLGVEENLRLTGFLTLEKLVTEYHAADVFSMMSEADTQSLSLMQAYAGGVPAVTARSKGFLDYVPPEVGYLVEPKNVTELTGRLRELLANPELREKMGTAAHLYSQQFLPETIAARWEKLFEQVQATVSLPSLISQNA